MNLHTHTSSSSQRRPPNAQQLEALLDLLGTDDAFRKRFLADPVTVLAEFDCKLDPADVPAVRSLPSKRELMQERDLVRQKLSEWPEFVFILITGG